MHKLGFSAGHGAWRAPLGRKTEKQPWGSESSESQNPGSTLKHVYSSVIEIIALGSPVSLKTKTKLVCVMPGLQPGVSIC